MALFRTFLSSSTVLDTSDHRDLDVDGYKTGKIVLLPYHM